MPPLGSFYFHHWYPSGLEVAGESSAVAAGFLPPRAPHRPEAFRPGEEAFVSHRGRRHSQRSQATAKLVQSPTATCKSRCVSTPKTSSAEVAEPSLPAIVTSITPFGVAATVSPTTRRTDDTVTSHFTGKLL